MSSPWKMAIVAGGSAILCGIAYKYIKLLDKNREQSVAEVNEVLMYGGEEDEIQRESVVTDHLYSITYVISRARQSVDVCLPRLVNSSIMQSLMFVAEKGRKVRVIIHSDRSEEQISCIEELSDRGIGVKMIKPVIKIEHEFILVDGENWKSKDAVALIGSLNYSKDNVNNKYDSTLFTTEQTIVNTLNKEFNRLWQ